MKQNNDLSRQLLILYCIAFVICCTFTALHCNEDTAGLTGYWEGEFMPGQGFTLVLSFYPDENKELQGSVFLFQNTAILQNDPLSKIELIHRELTFRIEAKNTTFKGSISGEKPKIAGHFLFPDGSEQPVSVNKVSKPSIGNFSPDPKTGLTAKDIYQKYPMRQLQEDFSFLYEQLKLLHPGLYDYVSRDEFSRIADSTFNLINRDMTEDEFFRLVAPFVAVVRCCHTTLELSEDFEKAVKVKELFIPFKLIFLQGKAFLAQNLTGYPDIVRGTEILAINGLPATEIKKRMLAGIPSDGFNITFKEFFINDDFILCYSRYIGFSEKYAVEYVNQNKQMKHIVLNGIALKNSGVNGLNNNLPGHELPVQFQVLDSLSTGILTLKSFIAPDWQGLLESFDNIFTTIKKEKVQNLILDLRGNIGGHPFIASQLLSYLLDTEFVYFALPEERGEFAPLYDPISPQENRFLGSLYVLTDGGCLSTTGHFLSLLKYYNRGIFVGEETGGTFTCNDGSIQITLPHTGIRTNIARITFATAVQGLEKGHGIFPDFTIKSEPEQLNQKIDAEKQYVIELIKKKNM
ncbi:hypothetical protein JXQ31_08875 [candidate division KSB1 bacterium]|nr:hypothetical protein [candidate division KSB1 bacterium]